MAETYTQLYIQLSFSVRTVGSMISEDWCEELKKKISEIITTRGHKSVAINTTATEVCCVIGLNPYMSLSDLVRYIKKRSARFVNSQKFTDSEFQWQEGYLAFSCTYPEKMTTNIVGGIAKTGMELLISEKFYKNRSVTSNYLFDLLF